MSFITDTLHAARPSSIDEVVLPRRQSYFPSPHDWRDEILYFLLPDRFSDGQETGRTVYNRTNPEAARPLGFRWDQWRESGGDRFQGGNIQGIASKLDYLKELGISTIWVGPIFKQRGHLDTYHGYAIQDFLDVDERFGTRQDLVDLVSTAHAKGLRVILDIIFNHSGHNWDYAAGQTDPPYLPFPGYYQKGQWIDANGDRQDVIGGDNDGVWPRELQADSAYTRAGKGDLSSEDIDDDHGSIKRSDFEGSFRDFNFDRTNTLNDLARCYKYWIALTDCDGYRLDTLKHVGEEDARNFCGAVKEFASNLGKLNFFLVGEVGGPDENPGRYLDVLELNLNATLDIGPMRRTLHSVAKGLTPPDAYFNIIKPWLSILGSHRNSAARHVSVLDDHDHVSGDKTRFSMDAKPEHQVVVGVAMQLFGMGIPCIYYGTEQAFAGPEKQVRQQFLPDFGSGGDSKSDRYLRETMFGADHPRLSGRAGLSPADIDPNLPGFGAFGSVGVHFFDTNFGVYRRIQALAEIRSMFPALRFGRQYQREISNFNTPFTLPNAGELFAWSRILDEDECLCIANGNGEQARGGDIIVAKELNSQPGATLTVKANTAQTATGVAYAGSHPINQQLPVKFRDGTAYVEIRDLAAAEVLVLVNRP